MAPATVNGLSFPEFYSYLDLKDLSLCEVRRFTVALAAVQTESDAQRALHLHSGAGTGKRSASFLRYVVGRLAGTDSASLTAPIRWPQLDRLLTHQLASHFGMSVAVQSTFDGRFFQSIYEGMWRYQEHRLAQLACAACSRSSNTKALIDGDGLSVTRRWHVGLSSDDNLGRTYLLHTRPGENSASSFERIANRLRAGGVKDVRRAVGASRGGSHLQALTIPL
jgi:hypothetical protein